MFSGPRAFFTKLEIMFDGCTNLHFDLLMHFLPQPILIAHDNEESNPKQPSQYQHKEHDTYDYLVGGGSVALDAAVTLLEAEFAAYSGLKLVLVADFQLKIL